MNERAHKLVRFLVDKKIGVFVDDANLYGGFRKAGWRIDLARLRDFLSSYGRIVCLNAYVCIPSVRDPSFAGTMRYLEKLSPYVSVRKKDIKYYATDEKRKANMDVEIALDVVRMIDEIDVVLVFSGDSDFLELKSYVVDEKGKAVIFAGYRENMSVELRRCWHLYVNELRNDLQLK